MTVAQSSLPKYEEEL